MSVGFYVRGKIMTSNEALKKIEVLKHHIDNIALHWEILKGQCSDGDGFTERTSLNIDEALDTAIDAVLEILKEDAAPSPP